MTKICKILAFAMFFSFNASLSEKRLSSRILYDFLKIRLSLLNASLPLLLKTKLFPNTPVFVVGRLQLKYHQPVGHPSEMLLLLLLITRPLPRDGGMTEDHGAPEAGQLPRIWTRGRKETESRQRVSGANSP